MVINVCKLIPVRVTSTLNLGKQEPLNNVISHFNGEQSTYGTADTKRLPHAMAIERTGAYGRKHNNSQCYQYESVYRMGNSNHKSDVDRNQSRADQKCSNAETHENQFTSRSVLVGEISMVCREFVHYNEPY